MPSRRNCLTCEIHGSECFCSLSNDALAGLRSLGRSLELDAGERVLHEGYAADSVYVLCRGRMKLVASSPQGRLLLVRIAGPGDVLGLAAALQGTEHHATAEALEPCELKAVPRAAFLEFMDRFHDASRNAAVSVAMDYESAVLSARRLALSSSAAARLAHTLLEWGRMGQGQEPGSSIEFRMPLTHEELGTMAGLSRETVTRVLSRFRREGLVEQEGERMVLPRPGELESRYR
jgi:CRP/FNR family transcriptional regulator